MTMIFAVMSYIIKIMSYSYIRCYPNETTWMAMNWDAVAVNVG